MPVVRRLVSLTAEDGEVHDALLEIDEPAARARRRASGRAAAVVHVHGIMGNFLVGTLRFFPAPVARAGFPVLVLETRMGNVGQLFGQAIFEEAVQDVRAAIAWLREEGFDTIVLSGYSSGATLATRVAALHPAPDLGGLICLANPWGLPQSMRRRADRYGAAPGYEELTELARQAIGADPNAPERDRLFVVEGSRGPSRRPTARSTRTAPGGTRAGRRRQPPWPTARSARSRRRSCWCRATRTRSSSTPRRLRSRGSRARPATTTSR